MTDEVGWIFVGVVIGAPIGLILGYFLSQLLPSKPVVVKKSGDGYIIE